MLSKNKLSFVFALGLIVIFPLLSQAGRVHAQDEPIDKGITVSPVKFEFSAAPGETVTGSVKFYNATYSDKTLFLYTQNFKSDDFSGTPVFFDSELPYSASLKDWIVLDFTEFYIKKIESDNSNMEMVDFTINVPEDAEPGGHYAGIISSQEKPGERLNLEAGNLAFKTEQATIILLTVEGDVYRELFVDMFYPADPFKNEKNKKTLFEWLPVGFVTELTNSGNSHTIPFGNIIISKGDKKVDTLDFNSSQGNMLRNSSRTFTDSWSNALLQRKPVLDETSNPTRDSSGNIKSRLGIDWDAKGKLRFGKYNAKLAVGYDDAGLKKSIISEAEFWVIPWKLILVLLIATLVYIWYRYNNKDGKK